MHRPPLSIAIIGAIFLALAVLDVYKGIAPPLQNGHLAGDDVTVLAIGVAAAIGGVFLLLGHDWARWLLAAWMALHVVISIPHPSQLLAHVIIFGAIAFFLFRPAVQAYFRRSASP